MKRKRYTEARDQPIVGAPGRVTLLWRRLLVRFQDLGDQLKIRLRRGPLSQRGTTVERQLITATSLSG